MIILKIKNLRVEIKPLRLEDVYDMKQWGRHENVLFDDYNFPEMSDKDIVRWHNIKTGGKNDRYYGVRNEEGVLVGYMGIKDIKKIRRSSTLGIVFDPNYLNRGYGTESLFTYLDYYFNRMNMRNMILEVNEFNKRALRVYEKLGFKKEAYYIDQYVDQALDLESPYYLEEKEAFLINNGKIYSHIYQMKVRNIDFLKIREKVYQELVK